MTDVLNDATSPDSGTREKVLKAARKEFALHGLAGARVDRIAREASVNKAMLYYHFQSKENLYEAVVKDFFTKISSRVRAHMVKVQSLEETLMEIADAHARMMQESPNIIPILLRELAEPHEQLLDWIAHTIGGDGMAQTARTRFEEMMKSGYCRSLDVRHTVISFITMSLGYYLLAPVADRVWNVTDRAAFIEERKRLIVDLFLNGVKAR